ncbi:MAG: ribose-phosphate pyrophosphokinase [Patescibacteria group bacterium]
MNSLKIFAGPSDVLLGNKIAKLLRTPLAALEVKRFSNDEERVQLGESVNGCDVFFVQTTGQPADNFIRALQMISAAKKAGAKRVILIDPMLGWARQDRTDRRLTAVTAKLIISCLETVGLDRYLTIDLHKDQIEGFFDIPISKMYGRRIFLDWLVKQRYKNMVIVIPDEGAARMGRWYAEKLGARRIYVDKNRKVDGSSNVDEIVGEIGARHTAILVDDLISTGGTLIKTAHALATRRGVKRIIALATHGELSGDAIANLSNSPLAKIVITDTIQRSTKLGKKFEVLSVAPMLAKAIRIIHERTGDSISKLSE